MITLQKLTIGAAVGALMASTALAQTPAPSAPTATPPAATTTAPAGAGAAGTGSPDIVMSQKPDQWLATKFRGTDVVGADDAKIGDVSDILFDKEGKIDAYVISVGGFLGVGSKSVALAPSSFQVVPGKDGGADQLKLAMSKEQLTQAQAFEPYQPPRATTTGAGTGSRATGNGATGGGAPATSR